MITELLFLATILSVSLPVFNLFTAAKLQSISRSPEGRNVPALRVSANNATLLFVASSLLALLGVDRIWQFMTGARFLDNFTALLTVTMVIILTGLPGMYWTWKYARDGFKNKDDVVL